MSTGKRAENELTIIVVGDFPLLTIPLSLLALGQYIFVVHYQIEIETISPGNSVKGTSTFAVWLFLWLLTVVCSGIFGTVLNPYIESEQRHRMREEWEIERKNHDLELKRWNSKITNFEKDWQRKVDEENRKRELAHLYWDDVQGGEHCVSNGRKKYTARLANLTPSLDGMEACKATPITLNGVMYDSPIYCENMGMHGVRGHWITDGEGICAAYWEFVKTKVLLMIPSLQTIRFNIFQPRIVQLHILVTA
ncbi:hypothetical protein C0995_004404 [Termitomyces sp. Mi166|nr:hypothetical protein C0995_004404 [Termitomyces sp. Mi166\